MPSRWRTLLAALVAVPVVIGLQGLVAAPA